jgi:hypothetical protein
MRTTMLALVFAAFWAGAAVAADAVGGSATLETQFVSPPASARPWVYWFWLNSNIRREVVTADLEAMQRVGIGGVLIMDVNEGAPPSLMAFAGPQWRTLFQHVCREAARLGLEVNMYNCAGFTSSGGPWITPELSMQKLVWTETLLTGPRRAELPLAQPEKVAGYYRDIAVVAFPTPAGQARIEDLKEKTLLERRDLPPSPAVYRALPAEQTIPAAKIVDLTAHFKEGHLTWDVPPGRWTVLRFGHTSTGAVNLPPPESGRGLECDKLSAEAADAVFAGLMAKLVDDNRPLVGKTLVATHIDSWEVGSQNWTERLFDEFQKRRRYDPRRYWPVLTGRVVESIEVSERFLWDFRQTIAELFLESYPERFRELARKHGLRLTVEAYGSGPFEELSYGGRADEPMGEFWSYGIDMLNSVTEMTSAAHIYGKRIVGAESFTALDTEKWLGHPGNIKTLGDWAFCEGINRFVFHRYAMQPRLTSRPWMLAGPWALHYERTQTWWEQSAAWHRYVARCQQMLRQGLFVADICFVEPEGAPRNFLPPIGRTGNPPDRSGYNFDLCPPEAVLTRMSVRDGRVVLPDGMNYRLLVLPDSPTMTPRLLAKIIELVEAGATVLGAPPQKSPSLCGYPACDGEVQRLAARLWGDCDGKAVRQRRFGKGKVLSGVSPQDALAEAGVPLDFSCYDALRGKVRYTHRRLPDGADVYFVANSGNAAVEGVATFRVAGEQPEFWWPETGRIEAAALFEPSGDVTRVPLRLEAAESVFVVFRPRHARLDPVVSVTRDGHKLRAKGAAAKIVVFTASYGPPGDPERTRDVKARLQRLLDVGGASLPVARLAEGDDPAPYVVKTLAAELTVDGKPVHIRGEDPQTIDVEAGGLPQAAVVDGPPQVVDLVRDVAGRLTLEAWLAGRYGLRTASGRELTCEVRDVPASRAIAGPWQLRFPPGLGVPTQVVLDKLASWSEHPDDGVKYFSGSAVYVKTFTAPAEMIAPDCGLYLDLGKVAVIAEVKLNGRSLGVLWKPPFRLQISGAVRPGENELEVKVTNLWVNRIIGDEQLPEDCQRNSDSPSPLRQWPQWLERGEPSPTGRFTFVPWKCWKKDSPLQESGLLGPVMLQATKRIVIPEGNLLFGEQSRHARIFVTTSPCTSVRRKSQPW